MSSPPSTKRCSPAGAAASRSRRRGWCSTPTPAVKQYTSIAFTEALIDDGIAGSIGSVGDALDNALMESTIGLYKTEVIDFDPRRSWTGRSDVERETAEWVHWFNTSRIHHSIDRLSPIEFEDRYLHNNVAELGDVA